MDADKVLTEIKEAVKKSMAYDELNRKFQLITNKSADEVLQRLTQTGLPSNDTQNVRGQPKLALLHELAKFYPDTPEGLGITLDAKFAGVGNVEYNRKIVKVPQFVEEYLKKGNEDEQISALIYQKFLGVMNTMENGDLKEWLRGQSFETLLTLKTGYEVEEEQKYWVRRNDGYLSFVTFSYKTASEIETSPDCHEAILFAFKPQADHMAVLVNGTVEEANHG